MELIEKLTIALEKQRQLEESARATYQGFASELDDEVMRKRVLAVADDEAAHVAIVEEIIAIVKGYKGPGGELPQKTPPECPSGFYDSINAVLLVSAVERYVIDIITMLKRAQGRKVVYVSYNKLPSYTKKVLAEHGIKTDDITFIDCVEGTSGGEHNISPQNLPMISLAVTQATEKAPNCLVLVDTLSGFSPYHSINTITRFVAALNDKARTKGHVQLWVIVDDDDEKNTISKVTQLCDLTVRLN
jgi:hypothetical protein